jgi:3-ketosteroid 9alpha-monooxygenase subunit B
MTQSAPTTGAGSTLRDHGFHRLRVARVVRETADACSLVFEVPEELAGTYAYAAGQFCNLRIDIGGEPQIRCYSMSSSPEVDDELQVTVKRVAGGLVSNRLVDGVAAGDVLEVSAPAGFFQLTPVEGDLVAFAAGSGITPVFSLVKSALATTARRVRLLYANRDRPSVIFDDELRTLKQHHPDRLTVSHRLDEEQGFVDADAVRAFLGASAHGEHYICGPAPFMEVVEQALLSAGVEAASVHIERFTPAELPVPPARAGEVAEAAGTTRVTIDLDGNRQSTDHRPGTTILQTARQMGMSPPFSCESGSCATCMARLVEGSVSMYVNNALTPEELDEGWVLTCQSVPTTAVVHVVYGFDD